MGTWNEILDYLAFTFGSFIFSVSCNILVLTSLAPHSRRGRTPLKQHHVGEIPSSETNFRVWDLIIWWSWISSQWEWKDPSGLHLWQAPASNWEEIQTKLGRNTETKLGRNTNEIGKKCKQNWEEMQTKLGRNTNKIGKKYRIKR